MTLMGSGFRSIICLAILLPLLAVAAGAQSPDHDILRRLKANEWPRAYREQDTALLSSILADDFRRVDSQGNWTTKAEELAYVQSHKPGYDSLVFRIRRLDVFSNGTAIVAGSGHIHGRGPEGEPTLMEYQSTNVLIKRDGRWRAVASHTSGNRPIRPDGVVAE